MFTTELSLALAILEKALGSDHPSVATTVGNLAELYRAQGRHGLVIKYVRRASAIHRGRVARTRVGRGIGVLTEQQQARGYFLRHLQATIETSIDDLTARAALIGEGFEAAQLANTTGAGAAISRMAARFAAADQI